MSKALGKGLASLLPSLPRPSETPREEAPRYFACPVSDIIPCREQPRKLFAREALESLAASIREQGILQPLLVRKAPGGKYELIAGERRWRAAQLLGLSSVPVVVSDAGDERILELALIENLQREDLNPIETALAYRELQDKHRLTQEEIARRVGKDRSSVANHLRLLLLPEEIRGDLIAARLSMGQARALLALESDAEKLMFRRRILEENLSVRQIEELIRRRKTEKPEPASLPRVVSPELRGCEERLTRKLGVKVRLKGNAQSGKLVFDYYNASDLERILEYFG